LYEISDHSSKINQNKCELKIAGGEYEKCFLIKCRYEKLYSCATPTMTNKLQQMKEATKRLISNETSKDRSIRLKDAATRSVGVKYQMKRYKKDL
jgi:hypothetical protein